MDDGPRKSTGGVGEGTSRLDFSSLVPTVQELFAAGIANSMQRVYKSGEKHYIEFCNSFHLIPFPVSETRLSYFVAYLYKEGLKSGTAKSYLAAVRHAQTALGLGDPQISEMPQLEYIMKGFKRQTAGFGKNTRLPITPRFLGQ